MTRVIRPLRSILVLVMVGLLAMSLPHLTSGSPVIAALGVDATPEQIARLLAGLDLDDPPHLRLWKWGGSAFHGDLGTSLVTGRPVVAEIFQRLPVTIELLLLGQLVALVITIPVALASAWRAGGMLDRITSGIAFVLLSTPTFVLGILGIVVFAVWFGLLPAAGWIDPAKDLGAHLRHMVLPAFTVGVAEAAVLVRVLRADVLVTLREPYILAARSRGMTAPRLLLTRALRPSSLSTLTLIGLSFGAVFGGSALIETVFAIPGIGRLAVGAIGGRDYPVIEAIIIFSALAVVLATLGTDILARRIDPRSRHGNR